MGIYIGDGEYKIITEVPATLSGKRAVALQWLLEHADKVSVLQIPGGRSKYKIYFDDGVYKGGFEFIVPHKELTPLRAYLIAKQTGWPGHTIEWLEAFCEERMLDELKKKAA